MAGFGRGEELEADEKGIVVAAKAGYDPKGLGAFLTTLADRNKSSTGKQGLFASHPEMDERLKKLDKKIADQKLTGIRRARRAVPRERHLQARAAGVRHDG